MINREDNLLFAKKLKELGINPAKFNKENSSIKTPEYRIYEKLLSYKKALDGVNRTKNPEMAFIIRKLIEDYDMIYEYKIDIINSKATIINNPQFKSGLQREIAAREAEIERLNGKEEIETSGEDLSIIKAKGFYKQLIAKVNIDNYPNKRYPSLACNELVLFYRQMIREIMKGNRELVSEYQSYIEKFDLCNYCERIKSKILRDITEGKTTKSESEYLEDIKEINEFENEAKRIR